MNRRIDGVGGSGPGTNDVKCPDKGYFFLGAFAPLEGKVFDGECPDAGQVF